MPKSCCGPLEDLARGPCHTAAAKAASAANASLPGVADIVWLRGGRTYCGTLHPGIPGDGEERRQVRIQDFGIDRSAVTNRRFAAFIDATGYRTEAEAFGWSIVFKDALSEEVRRTTQRFVSTPWWHKVERADWSHPAGPESSISEIMDHPVVHVGWTDAMAFAAWAGGRLLSESEWEFAARGGRDVVYPWGDEDPPDDVPRCNIWQGPFPSHNQITDGYETTAPAESFETNGFGLYNMSGNTWEWCSEAFRVRSLSAAGKARDSAARQASEKLLKGGSFLCHRSYCHRYRIAARMGRSPDTSSGHIGFRLGYDSR